MAALTLRVITPDQIVLDTTVDTVNFPALDGLMGVLSRHAPMVTALDAGPLVYSGSEGAGTLFVSGGFAEVRNNTVRVVTEASEPASSIDIERATEAAERARKRLADRDSGEAGVTFDGSRAQAALRRALMRSNVASKARR